MMNRMGLIARGLVLLVIIGAIVAGQAVAQPIKAPYTITTPGVYQLTEDARSITDIYGITIECSNVILDGGNHFLGGEQREKSVGVYVNKYGESITNITIKNLIIEDWATGVGYNYVKGEEGDSNLITKCDIVKSTTAIHVQYSDHVTVSENQINGCSSGIVVEDRSTNTQLEKNVISKNGQGMSIFNSPYTTVAENNINTCDVYGLEVIGSDHVTIKKNAISDNIYAAVRLDSSRNAIVTGNNISKTKIGPALILGNEVREAIITDNIFSSFENVVVDAVSSDIIWNETQTVGMNILGGPYLGGNFWSGVNGGTGFSDTAPDEDGYGISDVIFQINEYNIDYLPLTKTTATKAPEEQITVSEIIETVEESPDNLTEESQQQEPDQIESLTVVNETIPQVQEITDTPKSIVPVNETQNGSISAESTSMQPAFTLVLDQNISEKNFMNNSFTNAYSNGEGLTEISEPLQAEESANLTDIEPDNQTPNILAQSHAKENYPQTNTTPPSVGFLVFNASESGFDIILTATSGMKITLDPMVETTLTVPVPTEGLIYTKYEAKKNGKTVISGEISPYPGPGEKLAIPLIVNLTTQEKPLPLTNETLIIQTNVTPTPKEPVGNTTTETSFPLAAIEILNATSSIAPVTVVSNSYEPLVPINEVAQGSSLTHTIRASSGPGGEIFPSGPVKIQDGGSVAFIIDPNEGRKVSYLVIDGLTTSPMSEYRFINVQGDHTIVAGFV